ncbi:MAG: hypothetical protein Q8P20_06470 [bacterium]|nr:hypothetical protein [bacterium]
MCLKPGTRVIIDGKEATVTAATGNRIVALDVNGIPLVRDVYVSGQDMVFSPPPVVTQQKRSDRV